MRSKRHATARRRDRADITLLDGLRGLHRLRRCINGLGNLPAFTLKHHVRSGRIDWWELLRDDRQLRPYDFEFFFSIAGRRDTYHAENVRRLRVTGAPQVASLFGFWDLYVPLVIGRTSTLVFFCGQWAKELPTRELVTRVWRELSGREPVTDDALFLRWARCCLAVPVLTSEVQAGLVKLGGLLRPLFSGDSVSARRRIEGLRARAFVPELHDDGWVESCLDTTGLTRPPWGLDEFMDERILEETRLRHRPSQLAILVPRWMPETRHDQLDLWIQQRHFQHHAVRLAGEISDCVAGVLGDHAILVALAAGPSQRGRARSAYFETQCRRLQQMLDERHGFASVAALGSEVAPGQGLGPCFRSAALALEQAIRERRPLLRATAKPVAAVGDASLDVQRSRLRLQRAVELGRPDEARLEVLRYSRELVAATGGRSQAMIFYFLLSLRDMFASLESRGVLDRVHTRAVQTQAIDRLAAMTDPQSLMLEFERIVSEVATPASEHRAVNCVERVRDAVEWLRQNLDVEDAADVCARRAGLATSSFRRAFRRHHGLSFSTWLRQERLERAKRTLVLSSLRIAEVARDAGFRDVHTFIRCFRAKFGRTPGAFRHEGRLDGI
jgi:AraC-like DNA-binding protein